MLIDLYAINFFVNLPIVSLTFKNNNTESQMLYFKLNTKFNFTELVL